MEWLSVPEAERFQFDRGWKDVERIPIPISPEIGVGAFELFHLGQGMDIFRAEVAFTPFAAGQTMNMVDFHGTVPDPMFAVHVVHEGGVRFNDRLIGREFPVAEGAVFFQHVGHLDFAAGVRTEATTKTTTITVGVPVLENLLGVEPVDRLLRHLGLDAPPAGAVRIMPKEQVRLLRETLPENLIGPMRTLFSQAKALEFLCAISADATEASSSPVAKVPTAEAVAALREELLTLQGRVPLLSELASRFGVSARTLNEEFRRNYGASIYTFLMDHRLAEAHQVLQKTDLPMKALAANIGYSHVNHFIHAFRRKYGVPPGQVRRGLAG